MKEIAELFKRIMARFRFSEPMGPDLQASVLAESKKNLVAILKTLGEYSGFYSLSLSVFFKARRMGRRISVNAARGIVALGVSVILAAGVISLGAALLPRITGSDSTVLKEGKPPVKKNEMKRTINKGNEIRNKSDEIQNKGDDSNRRLYSVAPYKKPAFRIGVEEFKNENVDKILSTNITRRIRRSLTRSLGKGSVLGPGAGKRKHVNLILTGSVGRLGDLIMISAKVIDVEKGRAILITSENIKSENDINSACDRISGKILVKIRQ